MSEICLFYVLKLRYSFDLAEFKQFNAFGGKFANL